MANRFTEQRVEKQNRTKRKLMAFSVAGALMLSAAPFTAPVAEAVGNGPGYGGNETINTSILHTYDEMVSYLKTQEAKQKNMELEVIGQSVKGRDLYLVKYMT